MNDSERSSRSDRSLQARFCGGIFSGGCLRIFLILVASAVGLVVLFYAEEDLRGYYQWNNYRRQIEARGEPLDLKALIPKPVPDDQNFGATPLVASWFNRDNPPDAGTSFSDDDYSAASAMVAASERDKGDRHFMDLGAWRMAFAAIQTGQSKGEGKFRTDELDLESRARSAAAVLVGLKSSEAVLAELRTGMERPYHRYPVKYDLKNPWAILLPHLAKTKAACVRLQLRACAELAAGENEKAREDVTLMLSLTDSLKDEPFLISHLVRIACVQIAAQPVWEGLAERRWTDAQLQALETRLQPFDFLADAKRSLEAEQASGILTINLVKEKGLGYLLSLQGGQPPPPAQVLAGVASWIVPRGWYDLEKLNYCRLRHLLAGAAFDATKRQISPRRVNANEREFQRILASSGIIGRGASTIIHHRFMASMLLPAIGRVSVKATVAQTTANEAALACALERFRLARGQFPETLEALAPDFIASLPKDVVTGESYKYLRTEDGKISLYSVGWDEKDDGGVPGKTISDDRQGDWVWRYVDN